MHLLAAPTAPAPTYPFVVAPLPYPADSLEPYLDAATMRLHRAHHRGCVRQLNAALKDYPALQTLLLDELLRYQGEVPEPIREAVRHHGGCHANHQLFWNVMAPGRAGRPDGLLTAALVDSFGSCEAFQAAFEQTGARLNGAGWVFLVCGPGCERLEILALPNHDSVLPLGRVALLGLDVWEHAYFLRYQYRRADYLAAWWNVVNWDYVSQRLAHFRTGHG